MTSPKDGPRPASTTARPSSGQPGEGLASFDASAPPTASGIFSRLFALDLGRLGGAAQMDPFRFPWPGPGSAGRPGWISREDPTATRDVSDRFRMLDAKARHGEPVLPADAPRYRYLIIGGLFGKHLPEYMEENIQALRDQRLDAREVPVDSDASVKKNVEIVRQAIVGATSEREQVVILGHSKGGVDAAAALSMYPELKARVRALVAIQSPFGGSPIAQDIETTPILRSLVNGMVHELFQGDSQSVRDLTYDAREKHLAEHPLPTDVCFLCVATSRRSATSALASGEEYLQLRYGFPSDGLVVPDDAVIPGSHVVRIHDMDHAESTIHGFPGFSHYYPADVTLASVTLALDAAREREGAISPDVP